MKTALVVALAALQRTPAVAPAGGSDPARERRVPSRFDPYFWKYSKHYFGVTFDWRLFKAQLDPNEWVRVVQVAPRVPRWRYRETLGYVHAIEENYAFPRSVPAAAAAPGGS